MMKRLTILTLILMGLLLAGCGYEAAMENKGNIENMAIQKSNMDLSVQPGDDFNRYANGKWMDAHPVPEDFGRFGAFTEVWLRSNDQVKAVVTDPAMAKAEPGSVQRKIADFYASGMDSAAIDAVGISSLAPELEKLNAFTSMDQFSTLIGNMHRTSSNPLFNIYEDQDEKNSEMVIANLTQGGLGMTDRDQYLDDDERSVSLREAYKTFMTDVFSLLGDTGDKIDQQIAGILAIETELAKNSMTRVERRDPEKGYNPTTLSELDEKTPGFSFADYFKEIGISDPGKVNIRQPAFFQAISDMAGKYPVEDWKAYLRWNMLRGKMEGLPQAYRDASFAFYGTALRGTPKMQPRWRQVLGVMNRSMGEAIGQAYVDKYFPPSSKARMEELVGNLKLAYADRINNLDWMTDTTRKKALKKLDAMKVKVGYPDEWKDYSSMQIVAGDYAANLAAARSFGFQEMVSKIGKPMDWGQWFMPPQTVNAYYSPSMNEIVFPAAILQPPFFFADGDEAVNYGGIGVVIGHEITHGFDDQGRKFDAAGNLEDWWTEEDAKAFDTRAQQVVKQYNGYYVTDSVHVNGELTLGENIADLGGVTIAYEALQLALRTHPQPEKIAGFTQTQRFYLSHAQIWRATYREKALLEQVQTDPHSPAMFRVVGPLVNTDPWYSAFAIDENDQLYVAPGDRIQIW